MASCISARVPSCIRAPPDAETITSGTRSASAASAARATFSPTTAPIEPPMNPKSITTIATRLALDRAHAPDGGVAEPGRELRRGDPVRVRLLVGEAERVHGHEPGVVLLERALVEQLAQPDGRREPEVVAARRADAHRLLELLVEQLLLARGAARPQRAADRRRAGGGTGGT